MQEAGENREDQHGIRVPLMHRRQKQNADMHHCGGGQKIEKAHGMTYFNLASSFRNRIAEPLQVHADYKEGAVIELTTHKGQECDIVIKGALKVQVGARTEILEEGDSIYYNSSIPHGMIALGVTLILAAFSGFAVLADVLMLFGASLIALALGLVFLWITIWLIGGVMVSLVRSVIELGRKWCSKEVPAI